MKRYLAFGTLIVAACLIGSPTQPLAAEQAPLQPLAEIICSQGAPFPASKLFELFELQVPFLILTDGAEMLAASAIQCSDFRPAEGEPFYLVLGHRSKQGTATFFVTSLQGDLIQASRGTSKPPGELKFATIVPTKDVVAEFEAAKAYWLTSCDGLASD